MKVVDSSIVGETRFWCFDVRPRRSACRSRRENRIVQTISFFLTWLFFFVSQGVEREKRDSVGSCTAASVFSYKRATPEETAPLFFFSSHRQRRNFSLVLVDISPIGQILNEGKICLCVFFMAC